jgi:hypothetical protein
MAASPRILTIDPSGAAAQWARAAFHFMERTVVHVDVRTTAEAQEEVQFGRFRLIVCAQRLDGGELSLELVRFALSRMPDSSAIVIAQADDPDDLSALIGADEPIVVLRRPVEPSHFLKAVDYALEGRDPRLALQTPLPIPTNDMVERTPVPPIDVKAAAKIVDTLLNDLGALGIALISRAGDVIVDRGAISLDRGALVRSLLPTLSAAVDMRQLVGGRASALNFFDGDDYDVFVLSVGTHHFVAIVFDGVNGSRQMGAVTRYGRRSVEDLIALITASKVVMEIRSTSAEMEAITVEPEIEPEPLAVSESFFAAPEPEAPPEPIKLEPISDLDVSIFDNSLNAVDLTQLDDLFDMDKLAEIATETRRDKGPLSYEEARELGLIP